MSVYEYRVIAAPTKGIKAKGIRSAEDRFSHALEMKMNEMAALGWEYQRAEALPSIERSGLTSTKTAWHNVLVFRRAIEAAEDNVPVALPAPDVAETGKEEENATQVPADAETLDQDEGSGQSNGSELEGGVELIEETAENLMDLPEEEREIRLREKAKTSLNPDS